MIQATLERLEAAAALVHRTLPPTPQIRWPLLCERLDLAVWVKHENHSPVGAFKVRGGLVYFAELERELSGVTGVIAATRGNHGQSIAFAARQHRVRAVIVVPRGNSPEKNAAMRSLGAELIEDGEDFQAALEVSQRIAHERGLHFVSSFDPALVWGVASAPLELFQAVPDLDALYVPIGMGSGVCGAIAARDALGLKTEVVGVTVAAAPATADSLSLGKLVSRPVLPTIADGMACRTPHPEALDFMARGVARIVTVTDPEIRSAMRVLFSDTHNVAEGAGAAAFAALVKERQRMRNQRVAVMLTGGNVDRSVYAELLAE